MQRTIHEHITILEERIETLERQLADRHLTPVELARLHDERRVAELALAHFRSALSHEQSLPKPDKEEG